MRGEGLWRGRKNHGSCLRPEVGGAFRMPGGRRALVRERRLGLRFEQGRESNVEGDRALVSGVERLTGKAPD